MNDKNYFLKAHFLSFEFLNYHKIYVTLREEVPFFYL